MLRYAPWALNTHTHTMHPRQKACNTKRKHKHAATRATHGRIPLRLRRALKRAPIPLCGVVIQPTPHATVIRASQHLGGCPMHLRWHALPCVLQAAALVSHKTPRDLPPTYTARQSANPSSAGFGG